ncbi:ECF transporter S component [Candidatus Bathyarchaeota archaeon]|nr:ECF transporter S component [Candidatus Bathyarchaeota archaeon]
MNSERASVKIMVTVICAALYAVGSYLTAYIPSPWGVGQFRPAVVIPAYFAIIFGPLPAGIGAAFGTLLADSIKHGYLYPGSLIAAVPGNFIGFYFMGKLLWKKFSWDRFIIIINAGLFLANAIVSILYVFAYKLLYQN